MSFHPSHSFAPSPLSPLHFLLPPPSSLPSSRPPVPVPQSRPRVARSTVVGHDGKGAVDNIRTSSGSFFDKQEVHPPSHSLIYESLHTLIHSPLSPSPSSPSGPSLPPCIPYSAPPAWAQSRPRVARSEVVGADGKGAIDNIRTSSGSHFDKWTVSYHHIPTPLPSCLPFLSKCALHLGSY